MHISLYSVYDGDDAFAILHASDQYEAVRKACEKTDGHDPTNCTARLIEIRIATRSTQADGKPAKN